jgi:hypothetical protein
VKRIIQSGWRWALLPLLPGIDDLTISVFWKVPFRARDRPKSERQRPSSSTPWALLLLLSWMPPTSANLAPSNLLAKPVA